MITVASENDLLCEHNGNIIVRSNNKQKENHLQVPAVMYIGTVQYLC